MASDAGRPAQHVPDGADPSALGGGSWIDEIRRLRRKAQQAEQLAATLADVGAAPTLERALEQLVRGAMRLLGAQRGVARVFDPTTKRPIHGVTVMKDGTLLPSPNPSPALPGSFTEAIQEGSGPILVNDFLDLDPATYPLYDRMKANGLRAAVHVPIDVERLDPTGTFVRKERIGNLSVEHAEPGAFAEHEVALASLVAAQAGGAIARAWMAAEVDRMKTEFVSLVSHELRTPLTSIKGYTDLLLTGEVGEMSEEQQEFLGIVKSNADRLVALINDLLDVSRIEAGKVELERQEVDVAAVVREVAQALKPQIEQKGQCLTIELQPDLARVEGDRNRLTQVVTNLVSNAHKYTPAGGSLFLSADSPDGLVRVQVRDTGIGMTPDELGHLFQKFFRAKNRATQEVGGTGLGLAITKQLVELHGGRIGVQSVPGEGSTFTVFLPARGAPAAEATASPVIQAVAGPRPEIRQERDALNAATARETVTGRIVLVVDDEPDVAALLRRYLERGGYGVATAETGALALEKARALQPHLITLDINLPDTDGIAVLEALKSDAQTAAIPVVILSVEADTGRGKRFGAADYLCKPIDSKALLSRVGTLLSGETGAEALPAREDSGGILLSIGGRNGALTPAAPATAQQVVDAITDVLAHAC